MAEGFFYCTWCVGSNARSRCCACRGAAEGRIIGIRAELEPETGAVMVLLSTGAIAHVVRALKLAGRAEVELRQMLTINADNQAANARHQAALTALYQAETQARQRLAQTRAQADTAQQTIDDLTAEGESTVCPADCQLP